MTQTNLKEAHWKERESRLYSAFLWGKSAKHAKLMNEKLFQCQV